MSIELLTRSIRGKEFSSVINILGHIEIRLKHNSFTMEYFMTISRADYDSVNSAINTALDNDKYNKEIIKTCEYREFLKESVDLYNMNKVLHQ